MQASTPTILIFRIGSLGDTLVALPAFHLIRAQYPHSHIVLLTNTPTTGGVKAAPSHQILLGSGLVDEYIAYPHIEVGIGALFRLVITLRKLRPQKVFYVMPRRSYSQRLRDTFFFAVSGVTSVTGLWPGRAAMYHQPVTGRPELHESEANRLLRTIGFNPSRLDQQQFSLNIQPTERASVEPFLQNLVTEGRFVALSVGAKVPAKDWGQDRWCELLQILRKSINGYSLVFLGSSDESTRCQELLDLWPTGGVNLCGQLSPRQSAAVLELAGLFVGHDSGPMHLANSVGIPCVSIFAARDKPGVWFPHGNEAHVFYNLVPCHNCRLSVCVDHQMICIRTIQPTDVAARICLLLSSSVRYI